MPRNARTLRHRVFTAALSAIAIAGLVTPAAVLGASGGSRVRLDYPLQFEGDIDCGTFHDVFTDYYDVQEVDEFDADGNVVVITYKAFHRSDDRNSVTGYTLHERGRFNEVDDLIAGTYTLTGVQQKITVPGSGLVLQDNGRFVGSLEDGSALFFAGSRKHSPFLLGDQVYCDALS